MNAVFTSSLSIKPFSTHRFHMISSSKMNPGEILTNEKIDFKKKRSKSGLLTSPFGETPSKPTGC